MKHAIETGLIFATSAEARTPSTPRTYRPRLRRGSIRSSVVWDKTVADRTRTLGIGVHFSGNSPDSG
jgi:hypothetical protein